MQYDNSTVQTIMKNTIEISGVVSCKYENDKTNLSKTSISDTCKIIENRKNSKKRIKRSKSTSVLIRKPFSEYDSEQSDSFDSSLESLIKHNLSNIKALQPVPVSKAKQR